MAGTEAPHHDAAAERVAARERGSDTESLKARQFVEDFVREAVARGLRQTPRRGWYLRRNGSLAVDGDANFYVMSTATSFRALVSGAEVPPADPPLVVGEGARDGESMPIQDLLRIRLEAGDDWPVA